MSIEARHSCRLSELIGRKVRVPSGQEIGQVEDFVVHLEQHTLCYAALSLLARRTQETTFVAVPCHALTLRQEAGELVFILHVEQDELPNLPTFDPRQWPDAPDPRCFTGTGSSNVGAQTKGKPSEPRSASPTGPDIGADALFDRLFTGPSGPGGPDKTKDF